VGKRMILTSAGQRLLRSARTVLPSSAHRVRRPGGPFGGPPYHPVQHRTLAALQLRRSSTGASRRGPAGGGGATDDLPSLLEGDRPAIVSGNATLGSSSASSATVVDEAGRRLGGNPGAADFARAPHPHRPRESARFREIRSAGYSPRG
jgi:hypothetical protein